MFRFIYYNIENDPSRVKTPFTVIFLFQLYFIIYITLFNLMARSPFLHNLLLIFFITARIAQLIGCCFLCLTLLAYECTFTFFCMYHELYLFHDAYNLKNHLSKWNKVFIRFYLSLTQFIVEFHAMNSDN